MGLDALPNFRSYGNRDKGQLGFVRIDWQFTEKNVTYLDLHVTGDHPVGYVRMTSDTRAQCLQALVAAGLMCAELMEELAQADRRFG